MAHAHQRAGVEEAPVCPIPTKKACDALHTSYLHNHLGEPCVKAIQPSKSRKGQPNKIATCTIIRPTDRGRSMLQSLYHSRRPEADIDTLVLKGSLPKVLAENLRTFRCSCPDCLVDTVALTA